MFVPRAEQILRRDDCDRKTPSRPIRAASFAVLVVRVDARGARQIWLFYKQTPTKQSLTASPCFKLRRVRARGTCPDASRARAGPSLRRTSKLQETSYKRQKPHVARFDPCVKAACWYSSAAALTSSTFTSPSPLVPESSPGGPSYLAATGFSVCVLGRCEGTSSMASIGHRVHRSTRRISKVGASRWGGGGGAASFIFSSSFPLGPCSPESPVGVLSVIWLHLLVFLRRVTPS